MMMKKYWINLGEEREFLLRLNGQKAVLNWMKDPYFPQESERSEEDEIKIEHLLFSDVFKNNNSNSQLLVVELYWDKKDHDVIRLIFASGFQALLINTYDPDNKPRKEEHLHLQDELKQRLEVINSENIKYAQKNINRAQNNNNNNNNSSLIRENNNQRDLSALNSDRPLRTTNLNRYSLQTAQKANSDLPTLEFLERCAETAQSENLFTVKQGGTQAQRMSDIEKWLKECHFAGAINFLNNATRGGVLPPLKLMSHCIRKYSNNRFGQAEDADRIYKQVELIYGVIPELSDEFNDDFISTLMLAYLRRGENSETKLLHEVAVQEIKALYNKYKCLYTFNVLVKMYLAQKEYEEVERILNECPHGRDEWTDESELKFIYETRGVNDAIDYFTQLEALRRKSNLCERIIKILNEEQRYEIVYELYANDLYFPDNIRSKESIKRELMITYINDHEWMTAWRIFVGIKDPKQPSFENMIKMLAQMNMLESAIKLLRYAQQCGYFLRTKPELPGNRKIEIDVHSFYVRGAGRITYSSFPEELVKIILCEFYDQVFHDKDHYTGKLLRFISGQGSGKTQDNIFNYLFDFDWKPTMRTGAVECVLKAEMLENMKPVSEFLKSFSSDDVPYLTQNVDQYILRDRSSAENIIYRLNSDQNNEDENFTDIEIAKSESLNELSSDEQATRFIQNDLNSEWLENGVQESLIHAEISEKYSKAVKKFSKFQDMFRKDSSTDGASYKLDKAKAALTAVMLMDGINQVMRHDIESRLTELNTYRFTK